MSNAHNKSESASQTDRSVGFLFNRSLNDDQIELAVIGEIDEALDQPARQAIAPGTVLLHEGDNVDTIWIVLRGQVRLTRDIGGGEYVFHEKTTGPVIGVMALAMGTPSSFTCTAMTELDAIPLTMDQLNVALEKSPILSDHFVAMLLRSGARRLQRSIDMQLEINELNQTLAGEKMELAKALKSLKGAQDRLVISEKMATLGQLAAGIAHDLNNPIAAIGRAADFVAEDIDALCAQHPKGATIERFATCALTSAPLSTGDLRAKKKTLAKELEDDALAARLTKIGIFEKGAYEELVQGMTEEEREVALGEIESYYQLGISIRNIRTAAERIRALVSSLRSYARADANVTPDVDIHQGIEETLLLFGRSLNNVEVEKDYGELKPISCSPGEINQVWTNLISNAIEAMGGKGSLKIRTTQADPTHIEVRISDTGPGISQENQSRIFDMNFTTKHGKVDFGVGLGLTICHQIIESHGGTISLKSKPGATTFTIRLPINKPRRAKLKFVSQKQATETVMEELTEHENGGGV